MSAPTNVAAKADTKRGRSSEAESSQSIQPDASDRSVRQRIGPSAASSAPASSSAADPAAVSSAAVAPSRLSLMRLAVVERQLIMQGLDITSLARLASTCNQLRGEAMHREAGKFILDPPLHSPLGQLCQIRDDHSAHASALFCAHMPVTLELKRSLTLGQLQPLMNKAAHFSRITSLQLGSDCRPELRMLCFLAQPWIRGVKRVTIQLSEGSVIPSVWMLIPAVQHAVFALPSLTSITFGLWPQTRLFKSALAQAQRLTSAVVFVDPHHARSIRALRAAPSLTDLELRTAEVDDVAHQPLSELIWCLPPTLRFLSLAFFDLREATAPRSVLKAFFQRVPLLESLSVECMAVALLIQGMLDAGLSALPKLSRVVFDDCDRDMGSELLRRFLHRFPAVTVHFVLPYTDDIETVAADHTFTSQYANWPRVVIEEPEADGPPSPHSSDDDSGSEVEDVSDPGSEPEAEQY